MITIVKGNLLLDNAEALVNTVNTVGVMGKGLHFNSGRLFHIIIIFTVRFARKGNCI